MPDPEYYFLKPLAPEVTAYTNKPVLLSCLCAEDAETVWTREGEEIDEEDEEHEDDSSWNMLGQIHLLLTDALSVKYAVYKTLFFHRNLLNMRHKILVEGGEERGREADTLSEN